MKSAQITFEPARYAASKLVAKTPGDGSGFKTPAMYLIERFGGRWVHRDKGWQVSARQARRIQRAAQLANAMTTTKGQ